MVDAAKYFSKWMSASQASEEARQCAAILYNDGDVQMGDRRLNHLAALTWNAQACDNIFRLLENAISPTEAPWKTIYKALLVINTILLYGSELAVDKCINLCKFVHPLRTYNSALARKSIFSSGGTDYGAPVRAMATSLSDILMRDENIRQARASAKDQTTLVPLGEDFTEVHNPSKGVQNMTYGQGLTTSVGAGFGLEAVPGMYEGRPERYFDNANDPRSRTTQGNAQHTRDKMAPDLLDLAFDSVESTGNTLPSADYLPALQKQQELEQKLKEQQELLRKLQEQQQLQEQMRVTQAQQQAPPPSGSLLDLQMPSSSGYPSQPYGTSAYPPHQTQMAPNMMGYPAAMPQYNPQATNPAMYGAQPGYAAYGAPMQTQQYPPQTQQYPPQYQGMPASNAYGNNGYSSQLSAPSTANNPTNQFSPLVMGPVATPPIPGPALTPTYPGANVGGGPGIGANSSYNGAPPASAASRLFDATSAPSTTQASQPLNNIYSQPPMHQQQQTPQQPSQNMMNMGMFAPVLAPSGGLPPVAPPAASTASSTNVARPPPVDIIDHDYIAYFSAQYQSHNINFDEAAPPPVIASTLPPKTRMNVRVLSRGNSIHEGVGSSPLHWSFDHNQTAVNNSTNPHVSGVVNNNVGTPTFAETLSSTSSPSSSTHRIVVGTTNTGYLQGGQPGQQMPAQQSYQQYQQQQPYGNGQQQSAQNVDIFADIPMLPPPPVPSFQPPPDL